jgi:hypothetical protein
MAQFVLHVSWIQKQAHAEEVMAMRENTEKWMELCEQAASEQDPNKLAVLILEINFLLEAKELRLKGKLTTAQPAEADSDTGTGH